MINMEFVKKIMILMLGIIILRYGHALHQQFSLVKIISKYIMKAIKREKNRNVN